MGLITKSHVPKRGDVIRDDGEGGLLQNRLSKRGLIREEGGEGGWG